MSETTQFVTFSDLYTGVLNAAKSQLTQAAPLSQAKRAVNIALQDMHLGTDYHFYWAEKQAKLLTQAPYSTGTVSVARGSTTVTGVGTVWNTGGDFLIANMRVGGKIQVAGSQTVHTIATVADDTTCTIGSRFPDTSVTDVTYRYWEDTYSLASDWLRPVDAQFFDDNSEITIEDRRTLRNRDIRNARPGKPTRATMIDLGPDTTTAMRPRLVLYPPPDAHYQIPYTYLTTHLVVGADGTKKANFSVDTDEPILPMRYRHAIYWYALKMVFQGKDDVRRAEADAEYKDVMSRILNDVSVGDRRMRLQPRVSSYARHAISPYSGNGRFKRWSDGNSFDRR